MCNATNALYIFFVLNCAMLPSVYSYNSYESTTDCKGPTALQTRADILCLRNEMHFSTRQFTLSTRQCFCPLARRRMSQQLVARALLPYKHGLIFLSLPKRCIFPLDKLRCRLNKASVHSHDSYESTTDC